MFLNGKAGSGKSLLVRHIINELRRNSKRVFVTASTGITAQNIGGTTIHSFAGIGNGKKSAHELVAIIKNNPVAEENWKSWIFS